MTRPFDEALIGRWQAALGVERATLDAWLADHRSRPAPDPDRFLLELQAAGLIDDDAFRRALFARGAPYVTADGALQPAHGLTTDGPYALLGVIGQGAQGQVIVARDRVLGRKLAYKVCTEDTGGRPPRRFIAEAQICAQLDHPHIVPVYALHRTADNGFAYAMKLVEGSTLSSLLREARARHRSGAEVDEAHERAERLEIFLRVCEAIAYAHHRGVLHRDLKPSNIMVGAHREVYVMDWGVARLAGGRVEEGDPALPSPEAADPTATQRGDLVGTPTYMAPEQARGETDTLTAAADQYALGLILQELVTLEPAVKAPNLVAGVYAAARGAREPFVHVRRGEALPAELEAIVARATQVAPGDRYMGVHALADDVRAFLRGDPVEALPDDALRAAARLLVRHRERAIRGLLVAALLAASLVLAAVWFAARTTVAARERELWLTYVIADVERRAAAVESDVQELGRLAEAASAATSTVVTHGAPDGAPLPTRVWFEGPGAEELRWSPVYGTEVSFERPLILDDGAEDPARGGAKLALLSEELRRVLVRSATDGRVALEREALWRLLGEQGAPARRVWIALEHGGQLAYPATMNALDGDLRGEPWYRVAAGRRFLHWQAEAEEDTARVVVSRSVFGVGEREFIGVVAVEGWLPASALATAVGEAWLVDEAGGTLLSAGTEGEAPEAALLLNPGITDSVEDDEGRLLVAVPLRELGWRFIARSARR